MYIYRYIHTTALYYFALICVHAYATYRFTACVLPSPLFVLASTPHFHEFHIPETLPELVPRESWGGVRGLVCVSERNCVNPSGNYMYHML